MKIIVLGLLFNGMDMVSGCLAALKNKNLCSAKLRDGLFKKVGFLFCYALGYIIDTYGVLIGFHIDVSILNLVVLYACCTEIVSILENSCKLNENLKNSKIMQLLEDVVTNTETR